MGFKSLDSSIKILREPSLQCGRENVFFVISAFSSTDIISQLCELQGFRHKTDYLTHVDIKPYHFEIDVAGGCNLRCITCPRGNSPAGPKAGMMSLDLFKQVLDKLIVEVPLLSDIQLYSWGEPLLNPQLPEIIAYTKSKEIAVAISSNLSVKADLEAVIRAKPTWFRVSLSGSDEETYSKVHRLGKFSLVLQNLEKLSELRSEFAPDMFVEVNYHLYRHNIQGVNKMAEICKSLGFVFRTNYAFIDPLEPIIEYAQGKALPSTMIEGAEYLLIPIDEAIKLSRESNIHDCGSQNNFVIHSDLSFRRCTHIYSEPKNILADNFLNTSLKEIFHAALTCPICVTCRAAGVHRYHFAYINSGANVAQTFKIYDK